MICCWCGYCERRTIPSTRCPRHLHPTASHTATVPYCTAAADAPVRPTCVLITADRRHLRLGVHVPGSDQVQAGRHGALWRAALTLCTAAALFACITILQIGDICDWHLPLRPAVCRIPLTLCAAATCLLSYLVCCRLTTSVTGSSCPRQ